MLPPDVVVAELPPVEAAAGQARGGFVAGAARAGTKLADEGARPFWATVNICDTERSPNALGVRTSVPGNGSDERIYTRYTAQWWSSASQEWKTVGGSGVTDWVYIGDADMSTRQAGWTFRFVQPPEGTTYVMRGVVEVEWRDRRQTAQEARKARRTRKKAGKARNRAGKARNRAGKARNRAGKARARKSRRARKAQRFNVIRERTLLTRTGMDGVQGGDPVGTSKAMCLIW